MSALSEGTKTQPTILFHWCKDVQVSNITLTAQKFIGSRVKSGTYSRVVFSHCVFFGMQFDETIFIDCIFDHCIFEFTHIKNSRFTNCLFENSQWIASTAKVSEIFNGSMDEQTLEVFNDLMRDSFTHELALALVA